MHTGIKIISLGTWIRITNKTVCAHSKHDDKDYDKRNTLVFVKVLLIKLFPILIRQNIPPSKFVPYGIYLSVLT